MDTDNENEQAHDATSSANTSSTPSSSNNSSSSNLLVNLPMLPPHATHAPTRRHVAYNADVDDDDDDDDGVVDNDDDVADNADDEADEDFNEITMPLQQQSMSLAPSTSNSPSNMLNTHNPVTANHPSDDTAFISPLLFANNATVPHANASSPSSSTASSSASASTSTSSHNLLQTQTRQCTPPTTPLYAHTEHSIHLQPQQQQQSLLLQQQQHQQQQQQQQQTHSFPNSSIHQQHAPPSSTSSHTPAPATSARPAAAQPPFDEQRQPLLAAVAQLEPSSDEDNNEQQNSIADTNNEPTGDAPTLRASLNVASQLNEVDDLRADVATTSQQRIQPFGGNQTVSELAQETSPPATPTTLPLLLQQQRQAQALAEQAKHQQQPDASATATASTAHYAHSFHAHQQPFHYQPSRNLASSCSNLFNYHTHKYFSNNNNGSNMFGHNDSSSSSMHATTSHNSLQQQQQQLHSSCSNSSSHINPHHQVVDRLKLLYPNVNENETPLPRAWSAHDKCLAIGLSQNNLRVHYKGVGKQHNDAASVRTAHPIPPTCGIYYFEVKIISKGKNGYMGIGLTAQHFRMNRLPGWDKQTYGYHGMDGNSFSSSANGLSYGPTFTTGDVIGCCVNFVNNTCFYTKNGIDLGIAFRDLPTKLYPTVGLQTPGEEVDANFGQEPFKFDQIEDMMKQMRAEMKQTIYNFPMTMEYGDPTTLLHKLVSSYLVHNAYSDTAEAFARTTVQKFDEDMTSIRNRQKILKLIMSGKMGQAIEHTLHSYPGLLENNKNLWFMLKCRQFIEMVNGSDLEYCPINNKITNSTQSPINQTSVIQSTKTYQNGKSSSTTTTATTITNNSSSAVINTDNHQHTNLNLNNNLNLNHNNNSSSNNHHHLQQQQQHHNHHHHHNPQDLKNNLNLIENCTMGGVLNSKNIVEPTNHTTNLDYLNDVEMENNGHATNGNVCKNGTSNNYSSSLDLDEEMDIDMAPATRKYSFGIERILEFGKELSQMGQQLEKENKMNDEDRQMLEDAFSLIAYSNPWSSPLGWQLCPTKREVVCKALNSAILEALHYPRRPPLDMCVAHAAELLKVMGQVAIGCSAFVNVADVFPQN